MSKSIPLFVDLDGTIIKEDIGQMAIKNYIAINFFRIFIIIFRYVFIGKPNVKFLASQNYFVNYDDISLNKSCIEFVKNAKALGRKVFLISGSHEILVKKIGNKIGIFDGVYGTSKSYNMISFNKVKFINNVLNIDKFDYIGNSQQDLKVWDYSENVIYTNVSEDLLKKINAINKKKIFIKQTFN